MTIIQVLNLVSSIVLVYPSLVLLSKAIKGLIDPKTRSTSLGLVLLFGAVGIGALINAVLYFSILADDGSDKHEIARMRTFIVNMALLAANYVLIQVSKDKV